MLLSNAKYSGSVRSDSMNWELNTLGFIVMLDDDETETLVDVVVIKVVVIVVLIYVLVVVMVDEVV